MWSVTGKQQRTCDGVSRRNVLQAGAFASAGMLLPGLLGRNLHGAEGKTKPKQALMIFLAGGPSHYETFDPKPDAPLEIRGPYSPISTKVAGTFISETMPKLAAIADKYSLIRSCCHDNSGHGGGQRYVQTGYKSASLEDELPHDYPAVGSIVAKVRGGMSGALPTYMHLPNGGDGGPAFLGPAYDAFSVYSTGRPVGLDIHQHVPLARLESRRQLRMSLDTMQRHADRRLEMNALDQLEGQALQMISSKQALEAFDIDKESAAILERYGAHEAGKTLLLARRFLEAGAGIVTVRMGSWDHHGNAGGTVTSGTQENVPPLDQALAALITDLEERGMQEQVVLWCWGEFGRTPRINQSQGRDHWPQAMSVLVSGGDFKSGLVYGETNKKGEFPADRMCSPADVLATIYQQIGVDTSQSFINSAGRPIPILGHGEVLRELI